ncbi:histidinol-phosphate aminotransferase [Oleiphilus sp. HI0071]|jgi:histidinol-phosphate aminotransferase|uniref:histidinol-phosphate transaminase n=1 Tax=unclassified Oleiphilus TaxID=2631174 RepID=UPI0007C3A28C|nr:MULTISPECIES: histidinol-phosphate transaminase [unclassified Oleiphilus]KZY59159.1 histidinol-phosphate aminotransferase [Oleiphilus sp. HI0065]KZY80107.1 histidinol-phosphate aminotransferase [Oleiphilus sp. HI0071]KZY96629.1 histidinol-phosphate aminotransferase [Oleiphilus sp. HI0073]KZZ40844.1 histidinol-phosphate aminotransferase [Oleiphilus sp. HI0118]KZZ50861.1 histidinol-phosphate aminotransferase [Oleiphilus sp. HI0122]KZZ74154.1 histidinol-phosphate aminotransferase [Oleiphilus 
MASTLSFNADALAESLVREEIKAMHSYHVPDSSGFLKLDAMENPNPWPGTLEQEWLEKMKRVDVNRYPDPSCKELKAGIRALLNLDALEASSDAEFEILLGNGSDEIIQILAMALSSQDRGILGVEPSFVMYRMIANFVGVKYHSVDLQDDFSLNLPETLAAIQEHNPALVFLAVPNNPTGNVFAESDIEKIVEASQGLVVLDEAYMAFTDSDLLAFLARYPNVVVMRTFSKVGLAGLRLGFLIGAQAWVSQFEKLRLPYNINVLTQASAALAIEHYGMLTAQCDGLKEARSELFKQLSAIDDIEVFDSEANFVLVRCLKSQAREVFEAMKVEGVLIKCLDGAHPLLENCLRLTVGSPQQNREMVDALQRVL